MLLNTSQPLLSVKHAIKSVNQSMTMLRTLKIYIKQMSRFLSTIWPDTLACSLKTNL